MPTKTAVKNFTVAQDTRERKTLEFNLSWTERDNPENHHGEKFTVIPAKISEVTMLRFTAICSEMDMEDPTTWDVSPIFNVFQSAMAPAEYRRFIEFCEHPDHQVHVELLMDILGWIIGESTGFPTEQQPL